ncbi:macrophage colony-stimulating factor 1b isoform X1 [Electrophorus electricus]|uniref:macrophage colony-stimulating factor 1b isoform X1 n=2 Tax=Electrophorus electricus TaxID=8005 RepID=UPI000F0A5683|nr:macrophage colony-stimulating factor 1b isoform X1 [Electrophorus electricus]
MSQMTHYKTGHIIHKTKVKSLCILILLYIPLSMMEIPGPCRHSITKDHLLQMKSLINIQLRNGCTITYKFIERKHLSLVCYVKAALPRVLELLSKRFHYAQGSEAALSTLTLQNLILNIYSQHCVPALNEELEEDPVAFERQFTDSPMRALQRAKEVLDLYLELITHTHTVVDWACEAEYSSHGPAAITEPPASTEAALGLGGQPHQSSSKERFYKPGFIVLSVSAGLLLVLGIYCFIDRKILQGQLQRLAMESDRPDVRPQGEDMYPLSSS